MGQPVALQIDIGETIPAILIQIRQRPRVLKHGYIQKDVDAAICRHNL